MTKGILATASVESRFSSTEVDTFIKTGKTIFWVQKISKVDLNKVLMSNSTSKKEFEIAETWSYILVVPAIIGGFMFGYSLGAAIGGKD